MNETLEQKTVEELNNYKLTYENQTDLNENELNNENLEDDKSTDEHISEECTALVTLKENRLLTAQTMFKKSIKVSIKSFLISLSLSFLNLFI